MKTKIVAVLITLMSFGVAVNAQDHKGHQHSTPAKTEMSPEMKDHSPASCCQEMKEMKDMKSCQGMDQHKTTGEKADQAKTTTKDATVVYTCPMHPDVRSDKPGKCPKCGMDLVKAKK